MKHKILAGFLTLSAIAAAPVTIAVLPEMSIIRETSLG